MKKRILIFCMLLSILFFKNADGQINYQWAKSIGSHQGDAGKAIAVDGGGNVYATGFYGGSADFNPFGGVSQVLTRTGLFDCFIVKYNALGSIMWKDKVRPSNIASAAAGLAIAVDGSGNVYILGIFGGTIGFSLSTTDSLTSAGANDCFFAKYSSSGVFQWAKRFGGADEDWGLSIAVDGTGTGVFLTGYFKGVNANFSGQSGVDATLTNATASNKDAFLAKYNTAGVFQWAKGIGGSGEDIGTAVDANNTYVTITGSFQGTVDFNPGSTPQSQFAAGLKDAFVVKYFLDGTFGWAIRLGHPGNTNIAQGTGITLDANNVYVTGIFRDSIDFDINTKSHAAGLQDAFFAKYSLSTTLGFGYNIGSANNPTDTVNTYDIAIDPSGSGDIYLTGAYNGRLNINPAQGGDTLDCAGLQDIFFSKYDNSGNKIWARRIGGAFADVGLGIAVGNSGNVFLTGYYQDTINFDPGAGIAMRGSAGDRDIFIAKFREGTSTITGHVTRSSNGGIISLGNNNTANLYTQITNDGNLAMHLVETVSIDAQGDYSFSDVCADSYKILAIADTLTYPLVASTFYGNTTHWQGATVITTTTNSTHTADIIMNELSAFTGGTATIGGIIKEGAGYNRGVGEPIAGIPVGLEGDPGSLKAPTLTDANGVYSFDHVPNGNYKIYVNIPGLPMDSTYKIHISGSVSRLNYNFVADSSSIDTIPGLPNSIFQIASSSKTKILVYPNPSKGFTTIEFTMPETNLVQMDAYNLLGEKVAEIFNEKKQAGIVRYRFNAVDTGLKAGIYMLKLKIGDEISTIKMIQVE